MLPNDEGGIEGNYNGQLKEKTCGKNAFVLDFAST
jgi:hypothetical protein